MVTVNVLWLMYSFLWWVVLHCAGFWNSIFFHKNVIKVNPGWDLKKALKWLSLQTFSLSVSPVLGGTVAEWPPWTTKWSSYVSFSYPAFDIPKVLLYIQCWFLTRSAEPTIVEFGERAVVFLNNTITLTCETNGTPKPNITWWFQGQEIFPDRTPGYRLVVILIPKAWPSQKDCITLTFFLFKANYHYRTMSQS